MFLWSIWIRDFLSSKLCSHVFSSNSYPSPMHTPTLICVPLPVPVLVCIPHSALLLSHLSSLPLDSSICIFCSAFSTYLQSICSHFLIFSQFTVLLSFLTLVILTLPHIPLSSSSLKPPQELYLLFEHFMASYFHSTFVFRWYCYDYCCFLWWDIHMWGLYAWLLPSRIPATSYAYMPSEEDGLQNRATFPILQFKGEVHSFS